MKAKVIETGEIIDVYCLYPVTYSRLDGNGKIIEEYNEDDLEFIKDKKSRITEERIFDFKDHEYWPVHYPPKEEGWYMTIRCGYTGIYTHLDEWKDNKWLIGILDGSRVIAYSKEQLTKEDIDEYVREMNKKYKK